MNRGHLTTLRLALTAAVLGATLLSSVSPADANTPITRYSAIPSTSQAGGHPDVLIDFAVRNRLDQMSQSLCNCEDAKDALVSLPTGFIGNPSATPQCSIADFSADDCPVDSIVGVVEVDIGITTFIAPTYNLIPPPDVAGMTAFKLYLVNQPSFTVLSGRTDSDYGLDAKVTSIFHGFYVPLKASKQVLWGVPADPKHDALRLDTANLGGEPAVPGSLCDANGALSGTDPNSVVRPCGSIAPAASNSGLIPYLQNPTTCDAPLSTSLEVLSYDGGTDRASMAWPSGTGCSQLSFNPSLYAKPTTDQTDAPSGIDVELTVPQPLSPTIPSPSELRSTTVTLPEGFSINPNAADGKVACADLEANFGTLKGALCPEFSKVGSLEIVSSALPGPLPGFVYLGEPLPGDRYRLIMAADGYGTHLKLPGTISADPSTGRLAVSFKDLPQSPLSAFRIHFFGSERGALSTPTQCGTYEVTSTFVPWSERTAPQTSSQYFTLDKGPNGSPCPGRTRPFAPRFSAASTGNTAGAYSPFSAELRRADGEQSFSGLSVAGPRGFAASLRGVEYCPESAISQLPSPLYSGIAELSSSLCPAGSQVGTTVVGLGAGSRPLYVPGKAYLAGPYKGAAVSLVFVTPAVSGPYDLGNVILRAAVYVDPVTAQVTATADPLPRIVGGIPLRLRTLRLDVNRPGFALNPTNCEQMSVDASISGDEGAEARVSDVYQVANCRSLPYRPRVRIKLSGGVERRGHPAIRVSMTTKPGEAASRRISVMLPKGEQLDNSHLETICTRPAFARDACPAGSRIGAAEVTSPLLDRPLRGSVYLRASNHDLPDIVFDLEGQFAIEAVGHVDSVNARLRTVFENLPDVPVSRIDVTLEGGRRGLVVNTESLCGRTKRATVKMAGQNGISVVGKPKVGVDCGSSPRRHRDRNKGGRG